MAFGSHFTGAINMKSREISVQVKVAIVRVKMIEKGQEKRKRNLLER